MLTIFLNQECNVTLVMQKGSKAGNAKAVCVTLRPSQLHSCRQCYFYVKTHSGDWH